MSRARGSARHVALLLLEWQSTGDERALEELFRAISPLAEKVVRQGLRSAGIADPGAIDEAMSKVFDHLRRLHAASAAGRGVAMFRMGSVDRDRQGSMDTPGDAGDSPGDAGIAFIRWLAKERARDIARAVFRRGRHIRLFSQLASEDAGIVRSIPARDPCDAERLGNDVLLALESLDGRSRSVVELLLEGESQAAISRRMGVCEGTVSRIRARAIAALRAAIEVHPDSGLS